MENSKNSMNVFLLFFHRRDTVTNEYPKFSVSLRHCTATGLSCWVMQPEYPYMESSYNDTALVFQ